MKPAVRCDSLRYFRATGRVTSSKLFPLKGSGIPGIRVLPGKEHMDALYEEFARLLVMPDALDPDSETAKQLAEVKAKLEPYKKAEALLIEQAFEDSLLMPIDAGATFDEKLAKALADARDRTRAADDAAPGDQ